MTAESSLLLRARPVSEAQWNSSVIIGTAGGRRSFNSTNCASALRPRRARRGDAATCRRRRPGARSRCRRSSSACGRFALNQAAIAGSVTNISPASQPSSAAPSGDDDREPLHDLHQQRAADDDQRDRRRQADDQQDQPVGLGRAAGGGRHGDDVVDAHHQVGDEDGADRRAHRSRLLDLALFLGVEQELDADPEQRQGADDLQVGHLQHLDGDDRQHDPHHDRGGAAVDDRLLLLLRRQRPRRHRDHDRVVAREQDVGDDDRAEGAPDGARRQCFHGLRCGRDAPLKPAPSSGGPSPTGCASP